MILWEDSYFTQLTSDSATISVANFRIWEALFGPHHYHTLGAAFAGSHSGLPIPTWDTYSEEVIGHAVTESAGSVGFELIPEQTHDKVWDQSGQ